MKTALFSFSLVAITLSGCVTGKHYDADAEIEASNKFATATNNDKRRPTSENISGSWTTAPNTIGYTIRLEQTNERITGQGYHWGCLGYFSPFQISGTYKNGVASLRFKEPGKFPSWTKFQYTLDDKKPCLKELRADSPEWLLPCNAPGSSLFSRRLAALAE
jgi:hypothetical protein